MTTLTDRQKQGKISTILVILQGLSKEDQKFILDQIIDEVEN